MRKVPLITGCVYHVFNRSIANYVIFNNDIEFFRFFNVILYYQRQREKTDIEFSRFIEAIEPDKHYAAIHEFLKDKPKLVEILAYCLMPTHFHIVVKQLIDGGISKFLNDIQNSYSRYFNLRHQRKGPLWEGRFKNILVDTDEQLLHLTRYVHLNPTTAELVERPEDWQMSSYREYLLQVEPLNRICDFNQELLIEPASYKKFVNDNISYQRDLAKIKHLLFD